MSNRDKHPPSLVVVEPTIWFWLGYQWKRYVGFTCKFCGHLFQLIEVPGATLTYPSCKLYQTWVMCIFGDKYSPNFQRYWGSSVPDVSGNPRWRTVQRQHISYILPWFLWSWFPMRSPHICVCRQLTEPCTFYWSLVRSALMQQP